MQDFAYTQADLAKVIGKSRSHVANTLRLMNLSDNIKAMVAEGILSAGHARALLTLKNPDAVASRIVAQGLSVRDVERLAQAEHDGDAPKSKPSATRDRPAQKDADTRALEQALTDSLGFTVAIDHRGDGGELRIQYKTLEQLDSLCHRLRQ
jgi:ParB family chromosome partitioning protein